MRRLLVSIVAVVSLLTTACNAGPHVGEPGGPSAYDPGDRAIMDTVTVTIPQCEEDEPYLQGKGDFDGTRWDYYVCLHQDDVKVNNR